MKAATLFSGIGAPELAMPGWQWLWSAEIDPFAKAVLAARHPATPNLGDVTAHDFAQRAAAIGRPDVLVFGSPCQSFSIAGKRGGLDDARGDLALTAIALARELAAAWICFENVPGLLSADDGNAFEHILSALEDSGYSACWRILDAQYFELAQRRERLFIVACLGDWRPPAAVLFEPSRVAWNPAPGREAGAGVAGALTNHSGTGGGWRIGADEAAAGHVVAAFGGNNTAGPIAVATARNGHGGPHGRMDFETETFVVATALRARDGAKGVDSDATDTLVEGASGVRRLTVEECESLQGFPRGFTAIAYGRGAKPAADGPRYKAIGNAMPVPVMRWLLGRIEHVHLQGSPS